ncbi:uncharacterized protein LOC127749939 [Frankliniella occidentalis]|uniref:Uncharacterized protein LOC127749939 n=1 Tax=Frankliniella occidentalis TaxID=133901 RepID=A0A9C6UBZ0_FRAOC|nr:uncharacterized protein LOC127749939 [Frankliniella occidentalis]
MIEGNLLEAMDTEGFSAAHCVARDMRMGRGIALKLKTKLNIDTETLKKNCQVSDIVEMKIGNDYLLNLVTKKVSRELPNWNDFKKTIKKLPETCERLKINKLIMPKIGCGLDAFKWPNVMKLLKSVFYNSNIEVYVLYNDKDEEPMYARSKDGKKKFLLKEKRKATTEIVGDSHAKGILQILRKDKDQTFYAQATGGATTSAATKNLNLYSSYLSPEDNLVVITGTNDIDLNNENQDLTSHDEARKDIVSQAKHTKVTILTIPYRYDETDANGKIDIYNNHIRNMILTEANEQGLLERIQIVDVNKVLTKEHYSELGLHLNTEGKEVFCKLITTATSESGTLSCLPTPEESTEDEEDTEIENIEKPDSDTTLALDKSKDEQEVEEDMGFGLFD